MWTSARAFGFSFKGVIIDFVDHGLEPIDAHDLEPFLVRVSERSGRVTGRWSLPNPADDMVVHLRETLVWVKDHMVLGHGDYHYRHEPIAYGYAPGPGRWGRGSRGWYGGNDQDSVIEVPRPVASPDHPTAKPVELIRRCISNSSRRGHRMLDPFCGSGATLVAAELLGRSGYGMEIDPAYCDVAVARLESITGEKATRKRQRS